MIAVVAVLTFAAYSHSTRTPKQLFVVATRPLQPGQRLMASDLTTVALDVPVAAVRGQLFGSPRSLIGASVLAPISTGALVEASAVVGRGGPPGTREVSLTVDRSRAVGGSLKNGILVWQQANGRPPTNRQLDPYWRLLMAANKRNLLEPGNPSFLVPGQRLSVPTPPSVG